MFSSTWLELLAVASVVLLAKHYRDRRLANPKSLPYPPGPKPLPVIGNLFDMPTGYDWLTYAEWAKKYGDIFHMKALNRHILVLNTLEMTNEFFEKRWAKYSDRPRLPMVIDLMGWDFSFGFLNYGPSWRRHRKAFHQYFDPKACLQYIPAHTHSAHKMLQKLLDDPDDWMQIVRFALASTIIRAVYGLEVRDTNEPYVVNAERLLGGLAEAGVPGAFLVDTLPFLKYVPSWLPGAGFKRKAKEWRDIVPCFVDEPFDNVKAKMENGTAEPCVTTQLIERMREKPESEDDEIVARHITATAYTGGADTSVSTIQSFFLAMVLHPDVQRKAQKQLDDVVGTDRLPEFKDIAFLPYVEAIVKELFRWHPVTPLAVAHTSAEDDEFNGYFIPKGTLIMGNSWKILHEEKAYPDPMAFKPERFIRPDGSLDPDVRDPMIAAFGFGRRICPGRHMAVNGALITIATLLATFNIEQAYDESGDPLVKEDKMTSGLISYPLPFKCKITPRSETAVRLIKQVNGDLLA